MENNNVHKMMIKKERYIQFRSDVEAAKRKLQGASTSEDIDEAIIELASLMKQSFEDSLLDEMIVWIADARLKACNLRMHDYTRKEMVKLLEDMLKSLDSIIEAADGIMVARGDMGVELPEEEVPIIQKMIIKKVYQAGKKVITATQMLDSMMNNPRPTRAETTDVANAIYDGTSAIMLSGETAAGKYPIDALQTMVRIAERTEMDINYKQRFFNQNIHTERNITQAVCHATCTTAYDLEAKAILTVTKSGRSARMISSCRPDCMVIAGTTDEKTCRQLSLSWGVTPVLLKEKEDVLELFDYAVEVAKENKLVNQGDIVVITSGVPLGTSGTTNMMKVQTVE